MLTRDSEVQDYQGERASARIDRGELEIERIVRIALEEDADNWGYGRGDTFHTPLWAFTRVIKSYLRDIEDPEAAFDLIESAIDDCEGWERMTDAFGGSIDPSDVYAHFAYAWPRIKYRLGEGPLDVAVRRAAEIPLLPGRCSKPSEAYARLVSIAGWLQVLVGDRNILLPCELMGKLLGVSAVHISRLRALAVADGYIREVSPHWHGTRRATEFRFETSRFEERLTRRW